MEIPLRLASSSSSTDPRLVSDLLLHLGVLLAVVVDPVKLGETGRTDEEVDGCERVVDGDDDEGIADLGVSGRLRDDA